MKQPTYIRRTVNVVALAAISGLLASCGTGSESSAEPTEDITLSFSSSFTQDSASYICGLELFKDRIEEQDLGISVQLFPGGQLGPDAERISSIQSGDIDIDLQEASLSSVYPQFGVLGAAYVFNDVDHAFEWIDNESEEFRQDFSDTTDVTIVDAWLHGARTFTSNEPIREPNDLEGQLIRFPDTPQYLANAEALNAEAVAVAYEEIYVALQQGIADGQENPVIGTKTDSLDEVQDYVSLTNHQLSLSWVTISNQTLNRLNDEQQNAIFSTISEIRSENRDCVEEQTEEILQEWSETGQMTVIGEDEVDRQAFMDRAEEYFSTYYSGDELAFYESIRSSAQE